MNNLTYGNLYETIVNSPELTGLSIGILVFGFILVLIMIISYWKVFKKANKPGWAILIPIYNIITMIQVAGLSLIYFVLLIIPIVNIYAFFKRNICIAKRFNKSTGFGIGISLLPIIFIPLLAFSDNDVKEEEIKTNNEFNAMDVIQNSGNISNDNVNLEPQIGEITNVVVEPNQNIINPNVEGATTEVAVQPNVVEPIVEETPTEIAVEPNNIEPAVEEAPIESAVEPNVMEPAVEEASTEIAVEPNSIEPAVETAPADPLVQPNIVDITSNNDVSNEPINAFNSKPMDYSNDNNSADVNTVNSVQSNGDKRICKNCGTEMPNIVTICPNCGVDNE